MRWDLVSSATSRSPLAVSSHPHDARVVGIGESANQPRRLGPVQELHRAVMTQQQVLGQVANGRCALVVMPFDGHQELVLGRSAARPRAPAPRSSAGNDAGSPGKPASARSPGEWAEAGSATAGADVVRPARHRGQRNPAMAGVRDLQGPPARHRSATGPPHGSRAQSRLPRRCRTGPRYTTPRSGSCSWPRAGAPGGSPTTCGRSTARPASSPWWRSCSPRRRRTSGPLGRTRP